MSPTSPLVLFLHGAGGGGWQWRDWRSAFWAAGFINTHAIDLQPNAAGLEATSIDDYVAQARAWCEQENTPSIVVGASMGGLLGLLLAETCTPQALVLVNSVPPAGTAGWPLRSRDFPDRVAWSTDSTIQDTQASMPEADRMTAAWTHARWRDESGQVMRTLWHGVPVKRPACPVLVICSGLDNTVPTPVCEQLAQDMGAERRLFPAVSHVGALIGPEASRVAQTVVQWLRQL